MSCKAKNSESCVTNGLTARVELAFAAKGSGQQFHFEYSDQIKLAGRLTAKEGASAESTLIDIADSRLVYWRNEKTLKNLFQLSYYIESQSIKHEVFFDISCSGAFVTIHSKGIANGHGSMSIHVSDTRRVFDTACELYLTDYVHWSEDPYPVGGHPVLMRKCTLWDDGDTWGFDVFRTPIAESPEDGMLILDPDTHPSKGYIAFGDPGQEIQQLAAFCKLRDVANQLLEETITTTCKFGRPAI
jgi:hypothetical protein